MQRMGLEWLYRVWQEPRRMWRRYAGDAPRFAWIVLRARLGRR
jgi:N-acetylglucosaminyldiphosphoundecaprenol N-acetyl-beta-D-mannosaminyltransferase